MNEENHLSGRNSTYDTHVDISFENLDDHSSFSIQAHFEKANDNSVFALERIEIGNLLGVYLYISSLNQYQYLGNCPLTPPLTQH